MNINRKEFLFGAGGLLAGMMSSVVYRKLMRTAHAHPSAGLPANPMLPEYSELSFAQAGEDVAIDFLLRYLQIHKMTYLDIGANDPVKINNTYHFYRKGHRGVLVEPDVSLTERLRTVRPEDTVLVAGIGTTAQTAADFYVMTDPSWNSFSKEEAEHREKVSNGTIRIKEIVKMPLLNINDVIAEHFSTAPTLISIDTEGLDFAILKTIDFSRYRPAVMCIETLVCGTNRELPEITAYAVSQGYVPRGGSFVNTIYVDGRLL